MIQELISVGFAVEFILDHLREVAHAVFMRRVQSDIDVIDARIEVLRRRQLTWRAVANAFFLALVGLAVLEIKLSFPDSVDDDVVSFFLSFVFLLLLLHLVHLYVSYSTYLACICHSLGL